MKKGKNIMRKIIGIVIASLVFCSIGYAAINVIQSKTIKDGRVYNHAAATVCVDGYKFVVWRPLQKEGNSMVQAFEERDGKSLPTKC